MTRKEFEQYSRENGLVVWSKEMSERAIEALEQEPCEDCVSRQTVFETIDDCNSDGLKGIFCSYDDGERFKEYIKKLSSVTPTKCIATIQFSKEDLEKICEERIEIVMKKAIPLDKVKQAREDIENEVKFWDEEATYPKPYTSEIREAKANSYKHCLEILDKLIAESEGKNEIES